MKFEKYTLKSGKVKWKFYHYLGIDPNTGKKDVIERQGFDSKNQARLKLLEIIREYENGQAIKKTNQNNYRFSEVTNLWLLQYEKQVKVTTFSTTKSLLKNHILPIFKDYYLERIDVRKCQEAVNKWYESYSESALLVSIVSRIFKFGIN